MLVVGGVGQLYQGDLDLGRIVVEHLAHENLGPDVLLEEFHYGAVAVAQRLEEVAPHGLLLVGAERRARPPATVERRRISVDAVDAMTAQAAIREAVTGYVTIDLVVEVAAGLGCLPRRSVSIEFEPVDLAPSETLSRAAADAVPRIVSLVCSELRRMPVLALGDELRARWQERPEDAEEIALPLRDLVAELERVDEHGVWGTSFFLSDRLRSEIGTSHSHDGMDVVDWALMWSLLEELERLRRAEAAEGL